MKFFLATDFGSTFTKLTAIDLTENKIIGFSKSFTTIETNIMEGFNDALKELRALCGNLDYSYKSASSSAAGGLKIVSSGLVPDLTAKASRLAASSAGGKVLKTFSYELTKKEQDEISKLNPDIALLSGGIDGGNKEVIIHNARLIAEINKNFPVIAAGNKEANDEIEEIMKKAGKRLVICENVMPVFGKLNISSAKKAICDLFIERIISAKGLTEAQNIMSADIVPTPLAVFDAADLLSKGTPTETGLGDLMAFDVGGATTDVYSMADGFPKSPNVFMQGLDEPFAKRTVEGDIGVRYSMFSLLEEIGLGYIEELSGATSEDVLSWKETCLKNPETVPPLDSINKNIDEALAAAAVKISAERHCGIVEKVFTPMGEMFMQTGKDLTHVNYIIGSGGSVINSREPKEILLKSTFTPADLNKLKPIKPKFLLDKKNCFAAMGLLGKLQPDSAVKIMKEEFINL